MKILCLFDLHQESEAVSNVIRMKYFMPSLQNIHDLIEDTTPDVMVVPGDTVPTPYVSSLNSFLGNLFLSELPVVAALSNHEFWGQAIRYNAGECLQLFVHF